MCLCVIGLFFNCRVQVESYIEDGNEEKLVHCASCQVKIFKVIDHVLY